MSGRITEADEAQRRYKSLGNKVRAYRLLPGHKNERDFTPRFLDRQALEY